MQQWNFGIEREIPRDLVLKASYVGTKGNYLQRTRFVNPMQGIVPATSLADEAARLPVYNALMAASNGSPTEASNRLDPRFNDFRYVDSSANSNYHAFEFWRRSDSATATRCRRPTPVRNPSTTFPTR